MMPPGIQWYMERSFKLTEFTPGISHSRLVLIAMVFLSVFGIFVLTDLSAIEFPCYVGINSSGKKACTFLLSSFNIKGGTFLHDIFLQLLTQVSFYIDYGLIRLSM